MSAQPDNLFGSAANDADAQETREWIDALSAVIQSEGPERGHFLLEQLLEQEKENKRPGSIAFAILFLNQLNCTVHDSALRERYLAKKHQYSFDLNAVLASTLDMVLKKAANENS